MSTIQHTRDTLFGGELVLWQPSRGRGYRFNIDPVLLCGFVRPAEHVIDLGAGCGVIGMGLLFLGKATRVTTIELQPELAELTRRSAAENGYEDRMEVLCADLRSVRLDTADAVVFNPPYFRVGEGRPPPDPGRAIARHEQKGTLADFVGFAASHLDPRGRMSAIVPSVRVHELMALSQANGLSVCRQRPVLARAGQPPRHVLVDARAGGGEAELEAPLVVHGEGDERFSREVSELLRQ